MVNIFFFLVLMLLAIGTGYVLLVSSMRSLVNRPYSLRIGASYFTGIAFYITLLRTMSTVFGNAELALWIVVICCITICLFSHNLVWLFAKECSSNKNATYVLTGLLVFAPLLLFFWFSGGEGADDPYAMIGTLHSVRYAWVSNFISACGVVPVLGQNTGQSILTYMAGGLFGPQPYWFLYLWLLSSIAFLSIFLYGFIRLYESRGALALCGVLMIMFGNAAFSLTHVLVIDSGSPLAMNGYTDSLLGIFSILMFLLVHAELQNRSRGKFLLLPVVIVICIANFFSAPQNMLYVLAVIPLFVLNFLRTRRSGSDCVFWSAALLVGALIAVPQGGMLTPKSMQSAATVPGLMTTGSSGEKNKTGINITPGVPFVYGWGGVWKSGQGPFYNEIKLYVEHWKVNLMPILWVAEQMFFTSIRVLFFPIAGLIAIFVMLRNEGASGLPRLQIAVPSYRMLGILGAYTFGIGFLISFFISLNGYKWELSRFMIPGILLGMLGFSLYALNYLRGNDRSGRQIFALICFLVICGPVVNFFATTAKNAQGLTNGTALSERFRLFINGGPQIDPGYCSAIARHNQ